MLFRRGEEGGSVDTKFDKWWRAGIGNQPDSYFDSRMIRELMEEAFNAAPFR